MDTYDLVSINENNISGFRGKALNFLHNFLDFKTPFKSLSFYTQTTFHPVTAPVFRKDTPMGTSHTSQSSQT